MLSPTANRLDGPAEATALVDLLRADARRMTLLACVEELRLRDGWVGAGFVRALVWDHLHGRAPAPPGEDIDIVWFDPRADAARDGDIEAALAAREPAMRWSVKNQARMHLRNGDAPYGSIEDATRHWPETATAVAVRLRRGRLEILAPFGLGDLFAMIVRPTPHFSGAKYAMVRHRIETKRWRERWPRLTVVTPEG